MRARLICPVRSLVSRNGSWWCQVTAVLAGSLLYSQSLAVGLTDGLLSRTSPHRAALSQTCSCLVSAASKITGQAGGVVILTISLVRHTPAHSDSHLLFIIGERYHIIIGHYFYTRALLHDTHLLPHLVNNKVSQLS